MIYINKRVHTKDINIRAFNILILNYCLFASSLIYANDDSTVMDLTDRGSITDTPHTVPNKKMIVEGGYQYLFLQEDGPLQTTPQIEIDFGLLLNTEFILEIPTHYWLNNPQFSGFDTPSLGIKHELIQGKNWLMSLQGIVTLPGGSFGFGHHGAGGQLNLMGTYGFAPKLSLTGMFGLSTETEADILGGGRFKSYNPSAVLAYLPIETLTLFVEAYGQSKTAILSDPVVGIDLGLIYQIAKNTCLDFEVAKNLYRSIYNYDYYVQGGITFLLF